MATTTTSTEAELLSEYWNNIFLNELRSNLVFWDYGMKSMHPKGTGTLAHWLSIADLSPTATALTEGTDPTERSLSAGDQTATVSQYGESVLVSDLLQDTWISGSYEQLMERLARNTAENLDTIIRNTNFTAGGSAQLGGTAVSRNSIASDGSFDADIAEVREAVHSLASNKAQTYPDGYYVGVVHPDVLYDLQGDTANWQEFLKNTETGFAEHERNYAGMRPGYGGVVGAMFGVKFIMSQQAVELVYSGSACTDVYQSYIFGPEHYGVSQLQDTQVIIKNPHPASDLNLYGSVGWKTAFATKELDSKRMVRLETGSSMGT